MITNQLHIYRDTFRLCKQLYLYINDIPKHLRHDEYSKAISMALDALDMIYIANSDISRRDESLLRFLLLIGGVLSRIRLFAELKYLSPKQSVTLCLMIDSVLKLATGWRNSSQHQSRRVNDNTGE